MDDRKEKLVSVIVPVHNVEKYLEEAVESVREQTYKDWELILVENGSSDRSPELCLAYEKREPRIRVFCEKQRGIAAARNRGMQEARGDRLMFLDADDYLADPETIERLACKMDKTGAAIVVGNYARLWNGRILPAADCLLLQDLPKTSAEFRFQGFFAAGMLSYAWGKLYRRDFLEEQKLRFGEYAYAEDKMFSMQCYVGEPVYAFVGETGYIYRKNEASVSYQYQVDSVKWWLQIAHDLQEFLEKKGKTEYEDLVRYTIFFAAFFDAKMEYVRHGKSLKAVRQTLKRYGRDPLARQSFQAFAFEKGLKRPKQKMWSIMIRGFASAMRLHWYLPLAVGIKLLIDCRVDERLSDTGLRE
mgnify:CR=1 FL=1